MGEVYRARDQKLRRDVALKILPELFASDAERIARFEREARTLASLNHPHIAQIYGFEQADGVSALVLELVEGDDLSQRLSGRSLRIDESIAIARQIADALDAAHEQGIVHRDLKPSNIKIRHDGVVKVLDFGLAKALAVHETQWDLSQLPTMTGAGTRPGVLLGTVAYMSPEQARGRAVDKRTDIWAFGCVLYEMLTGRPAFARETVSDTIASTLEREPDWSQLPTETPDALRTLLRRCLTKDRRLRLRDIGDARPDLDEAAAPASAAATRRDSRALIYSAWVVALITTAASAFLLWQSVSRTESSADDARMERVTFDAGLTISPALSRDGRLLAYASQRSGRGDLDIWVQQASGGAPIRVTDDPADDGDPEFSPDAQQIVFRSERQRPGIYVTSAFGGSARLLVADGRYPRLSPDGTQLAYWSGLFRGDPAQRGTSLFVLPLNGGTPQPIAQNFMVALDPVWAPDGRSLLFLGRSNPSDPVTEAFDVWWAPLDGGAPVRTGLLDRHDFRRSARRERLALGRWLSDGSFLFAVDGEIWSLRISPSSGEITGNGRRLALGSGTYRGIAISDDGQIVVADLNSERVVERAVLPQGEGVAPDPITLLVDGHSLAARASVTADARVLVYERLTGNQTEVWQKNLFTGQQQLIATVPSPEPANPVVSDDGARVLYRVRTDATGGFGDAAALVVDTAGGVSRPLCNSCAPYQFLPDHRRVIAVVGPTLQIIDSLDGQRQEVLRVSEGGADRPAVSPNGRWLAFRWNRGGAASTWVTRLPQPGEPPAPPNSWHRVEDATTTGRPAGWSADSRLLYLLLDADGYRCLWAQEIDGRGQVVGTPKAARHFHDWRGANNISTSLGNAIAANGFIYESLRTSAALWRLIREPQ
jgi:eukaryotic-like serine/threonine-protein kinase